MNTSEELPKYETGENAARRGAGALAMEDLSNGFVKLPYAARLAWADIRLRYRGSLLGPFWLTISFAVMVVTMGIVYARLFQLDLKTYLPFTSISFALWFSWFSPVVSEACTCFVDARAQLHASKTAFSVQVFRTLIRNTIVLAHVIVVPVSVFFFFGSMLTGVALWSLLGICLWLIDGFAACLLLGSICARYRDVPQIVAALMQIAFYITPIIWQPGQLAKNSPWLLLNPFYSMIEIVRAPLLGSMPTLFNYLVAISFSLILIIAGFLVFRSTRAKLSFWL